MYLNDPKSRPESGPFERLSSFHPKSRNSFPPTSPAPHRSDILRIESNRETFLQPSELIEQVASDYNSRTQKRPTSRGGGGRRGSGSIQRGSETEGPSILTIGHQDSFLLPAHITEQMSRESWAGGMDRHHSENPSVVSNNFNSIGMGNDCTLPVFLPSSDTNAYRGTFGSPPWATEFADSRDFGTPISEDAESSSSGLRLPSLSRETPTELQRSPPFGHESPRREGAGTPLPPGDVRRSARKNSSYRGSYGASGSGFDYAGTSGGR